MELNGVEDSDVESDQDDENSIEDEQAEDEDESYMEESEEESVATTSSAVSFDKVPNPFKDYIPGLNAVEIEVCLLCVHDSAFLPGLGETDGGFV